LKPSFVPEAYRSWALRYLKEAKVDLSTAQEASMIETVRDLSTIALRKAQLAIEYAVAQPEVLDIAVSEYVSRGETEGQSLVVLLAQIRNLMKRIADPHSRLRKDSILGRTSLVLDVVSSIVSDVVGEVDMLREMRTERN
jgi:hypothetical protein